MKIFLQLRQNEGQYIVDIVFNSYVHGRVWMDAFEPDGSL